MEPEPLPWDGSLSPCDMLLREERDSQVDVGASPCVLYEKCYTDSVCVATPPHKDSWFTPSGFSSVFDRSLFHPRQPTVTSPAWSFLL